MAVTTIPYGQFLKRQANGNGIDFDTDTLKVALCTSSYTPNRDTHDFFDDVTNELGTGSGYTAGGTTLTGKIVDLDAAGDFAYFDADDALWTALTATFRYAVCYKSTGVAGTSPLIFYVDFGADESPAAIDFAIQWQAASAGGALKWQAV